MKKLQVKNPGGKWSWVFGRSMPDKTLKTCDEKAKALPPKTHWAEDDLAWAQHNFPDREFRLGESLEAA